MALATGSGRGESGRLDWAPWQNVGEWRDPY